MVDMSDAHVTSAVEVAAPPEVAWAVLTDWSRQHEWMLGTRVWVVGGDGRSAGSRLIGFTGVADIGFVDHLEIVEWIPGRRCRARHLGTLLRGSAEFSVEPAGAGTLVRWTERLEPPFGPLGALGLRVARPALAWGMLRSLRRLGTLMTTGR